MKNKIIFIASVMIIVFITQGCEKYLDAKSDSRLATASRLNDLQAILDYVPNMLVATYSDEASADNFYVSDDDWNNQDEEGQRRMYIWEKDNFYSDITSDWGTAYKKIYYCNTVLEGLKNFENADVNGLEFKNIQGQALMIRGATFLAIVNIWAPAYDPATAGADLGIPLRLNTNFDELSMRSSVQASFEQIITDLKASVNLLPIVPASPVRASRPAAFAFLSRTYLAMRNYEEAAIYADSALLYNNAILDYNTVSNAPQYPFQPFNKEIIFYTVSGLGLISPNIARVDSNLYRSYQMDDLRHDLYFRPNAAGYVNFKGSYSAGSNTFSGISTGELFLTKSECLARAGNKDAALAELNRLLINRFRTGSFIPETASTAQHALSIILSERRKELLFRFTRWMDLKRLNKEGANIILTRKINGNTYTLLPNSLRYALPLPEDVIVLSGMPQNPR